MEIFGLSPVLATIIIVTTGLMLQNLLGWLKSKESYDIKNALASTIIAFVVGITIIGPQIEVIQDQMLSELSQLTIFASLVASIAGFDTLTKNAFKMVNKKINPQNKPDNLVQDYENLPNRLQIISKKTIPPFVPKKCACPKT